MKFSYFLISGVMVASIAHADFGSWTRNTDANSNEKPTPQVQKNEAETTINAQQNLPQTSHNINQIGKSIISDNKVKSEIEHSYTNNKNPIKPTYNNSSTSNSSNASISLNEQKENEYALTVMNFTNSNDFASLEPMQALALIKLNAALLMVGSDSFSGQTQTKSKTELNAAIGCVNSYKSNHLQSLANILISKHLRYVAISSTLNSSPRIGSNFVNTCG